MTESMIVEAIRAAGGPQRAAAAPDAAGGPAAVADPSAVARFQAAMGVQDVKGPDPIPFASEASAAS